MRVQQSEFSRNSKSVSARRPNLAPPTVRARIIEPSDSRSKGRPQLLRRRLDVAEDLAEQTAGVRRILRCGPRLLLQH